MRKRTQKAVDDISPQVQSELIRPYKQPSYEVHEYYQVPQPGIEPWEPPVFDPIPLPTFRVATPIFSVASGTYTSAQIVQIVCLTTGATIYYTTDKTEPHQNSTKYVIPLVLSVDTTLKAKAFKDGMDASNTATGLYIVSGFSPEVSGDDGYRIVGGFFIINSYNRMGNDEGNIDHCFIRFPGVVIPQGVTITSAHIDFSGINYAAIGDLYTDIDIYFEDSDDAIAPTSGAEFDVLTLTTATVVWSDPSGEKTFEIKTTPSLVAIVQEIVDRVGWVSGNAMMAVFKSNVGNSVEDYIQGWSVDSEAGYPGVYQIPKFYITWN